MEQFLQPEEYSLDNIFKGKYIIPVYQRPYNWGETQVKQLLLDIDEAYEHYQKFQDNNADDNILFAGTIFIKTELNYRNEYTEYTVVDGQQRITTLTLLLMAILNFLFKENSEDDIVGEIRNYLWKKEGRKNNKEKQVLTLGNIDKETLSKLFDELYSKNDIVKYALDIIETSENKVEINLLNNFLLINEHLSKMKTEEKYLNYVDFIKNNIRVISIKINTNMVKLFSIFESINSKGKPLDQIDLIKSYIFQNLNHADYDEYLEKWGTLIEKTNDNLGDYFTTYIRANITYYRSAIKQEYFKSLAEGRLRDYFNKNSLGDILKEFINDMLKQVRYYNMLSDFNALEKAGVSDKSIAILRMNNIAKYNHTEPLFFKLLSMRGQRISEEYFDTIIDYAFRFILTFQTISSRESKRTIAIFSDVQNEIYSISQSKDDNSSIDEHTVENIKYIFDKVIYENDIKNSILRNSIRNTMSYKKNKNVVKFILAYLLETDSTGKVDYLKLNSILKLGNNIHVDHILPQNPQRDNDDFKYYKDDDFIILKKGQDFTEDKTQERVPLDDFLDNYLHKLGNLRLEWANDNIKKNNHLIKLEEFNYLFNTNSNINNREKELIDKIIASNLLVSIDNYSFSPSKIKVKRQTEVTYLNYEKIVNKKYRPIGFSLFGDNFHLTKYTYKQLLVDIFDELYSLEKERFIDLANARFKPTSSKRIYISCKKDEVRVPYIIGNQIYIETNLSSDYIIQFCYKVIDEMGLERKDLKIMLEEK